MHRFLRIFAVVCVLLVPLARAAPAPGEDLTAYVPHITKDDPVWQDYLLVTNNGVTNRNFFVDYYDAGILRNVTGHMVRPGEELLLNLKQESATASLAVIRYPSADLNFRQIFRNTANGLAEFALGNACDYQMAFKFSSILGPGILNWSGLALANPGDVVVNADLYAIGHNGTVLGQVTRNLPARSRVVGVHSTWFPALNKDDIAEIIVRSKGLAKLCGIVISGTADASRLLFTQAVPQPGFSTDPAFGPAKTVDLNSFLPPGSQVYTLDDGSLFLFLRDTPELVTMGLYLSLNDAPARTLRLDLSSSGFGLNKSGMANLAAYLAKADDSVFLASGVFVPSVRETAKPCTLFVGGVSKGAVVDHIRAAVDGPWYLVDSQGPAETVVLTLDEEFKGGRFHTRMWLAKNRGLARLEMDGREFAVVGTLQ